MRCKRVERSLSDYIDGALDAPARGAVERHLASCRDCASSLRRLERTVMLVKDSPMRRPPEGYWSEFTPRVMERLRREEEAGEAWKTWFGELFWGRKPAIAITSAAAMAVAASIFLMHDRPLKTETPVRAGGAPKEGVPYFSVPGASLWAPSPDNARLAGMPPGGIEPSQPGGERHPLVVESLDQSRGWLGIGVQDLTPALQAEFGIADGRGVLVAMVVDSGPAQRAGIREGDVIRSFGGKAIDSSRELIALVAMGEAGKRVPLSIIRDGREKTIEVVVGARTENGQGREAGLGLVLEEITPQLALRFNVSAQQRGLLVAGVRPGSAASRAGLRRGDVIMDVGQRPVAGLAAWEKLVKEAKPGRRFLVRTQRGFFVIKAD